jgi:methyltransferase-like protein/trans-aconitate methyltransferase
MKETFSYDRLPYPSKFFVQTHPDRLGAIATLFGMKPATVATCRALEIGCGNGSNLIAQAYLLPDAHFVGIDLAKGHIEDAEAAAAELGLTNVDFRQADVMDMTVAEYGKFDYIVAHGLFSWVPEFVRERVLLLFRELLNLQGVGYISYNAFPGAHHRQMVQQMMRFHVKAYSEPTEKVEKAISFLSFLAENTVDKGVFRSILTQELSRHRTHETADLFHDDLSENNRAFYIHEFASLLDNAELQFLGEAELHAMGTQNLSPDASSFVQSFENIIEREQYLDFLRGRIFRQTLFCHKEVSLDRDVDESVMGQFLVSSSLLPRDLRPDLISQKVEKFVTTNNIGIEIDQPLTKAVLCHLGSVWGRAVAFPELVEEGKKLLRQGGFETDDWELQTKIARIILLQIALASSMVELHVHRHDAFTQVSAMPKVNRLARWQLKGAANVLTLLDLDMKIDDSVSRKLLELLDGTRDRKMLLNEMKDFIKSAEGIEDKNDLIRNLSSWLDDSLSNLARIGVFEA